MSTETLHSLIQFAAEKLPADDARYLLRRYTEIMKKQSVWEPIMALRWIANRYSDTKSMSELADDAYQMHCVANAAIAKSEGKA